MTHDEAIRHLTVTADSDYITVMLDDPGRDDMDCVAALWNNETQAKNDIITRLRESEDVFAEATTYRDIARGFSTVWRRMSIVASGPLADIWRDDESMIGVPV